MLLKFVKSKGERLIVPINLTNECNTQICNISKEFHFLRHIHFGIFWLYLNFRGVVTKPFTVHKKDTMDDFYIDRINVLASPGFVHGKTLLVINGVIKPHKQGYNTSYQFIRPFRVYTPMYFWQGPKSFCHAFQSENSLPDQHILSQESSQASAHLQISYAFGLAHGNLKAPRPLRRE